MGAREEWALVGACSKLNSLQKIVNTIIAFEKPAEKEDGFYCPE